MKKIVAFVICALAAFAVASAAGKKDVRTVVFGTNLHCEKCTEKVTENISFEKGVVSLEVSLENQTITIGYDAGKTSVEKLAAAVEKLGYKAEPRPSCCDGKCSKDACGKCDKKK
ncbi:MAG: heavy-metal-associated domain-containing protein, partial [Bacteroidales bacterium]|nr:heavy-metal-associated domain-containing protein [Bacteroidales bacterium]